MTAEGRREVGTQPGVGDLLVVLVRRYQSPLVEEVGDAVELERLGGRSRRSGRRRSQLPGQGAARPEGSARVCSA